MNGETWMLVVVLSLGPGIVSHGDFVGAYPSYSECARVGDVWLKNAYDWTARHQVAYGPIYACFKARRERQEKLINRK
jgi:hypothetical protein